jgi:hypothetical protein
MEEFDEYLNNLPNITFRPYSVAAGLSQPVFSEWLHSPALILVAVLKNAL